MSSSPARWPTPASLLGQHFWVTCYVTLGLGFVVPIDPEIARVLVPPSLCSILFFTALGRSSAEVGAAMRGRRLLLALALMAVKMVIFPLVVWGVCRAVAPEWATALVLVTALPAGLSSPTLAGLHRSGAIASGLAAVMITSLVAPITLPWLLDLAGPSHAGLPGGANTPSLATIGLEQARYVAILLGGPWLASRFVRRVAPVLIVRHEPLFRPLAVGSLAVLVFLAAATCRAALGGTGTTLGPIGLLVVTGLSVFLGLLALVVAERLPGDEAVAFPCGVIFMNNGLGVAMAARFFPNDPRVLIAAALVEVPILFGVHVVGRIASARATAREVSLIAPTNSRVDSARRGP